ncbi:hypothetical protein EDD21DRAFT_200431 [Dissophora ornata]|nr:hypothetical protein EDD21DRAFT_200431 [Dissophora ornata]
MIDATGQEHERDAAPAPTTAASPEPVKEHLADKHALNSHSKHTRPQLKVKGLISPELVSAVRVCIRSYGVGYVFATAPKLIKTVLAFLLNPRKVTPKGQSPVAAFLRTIFAALKDGTSSKRDGMSMLLMISLGGYKLLELFLNRGMKKAILAQRLQEQQHQKQQNQHSHPSSSADSDQNAKWTRNDADRIELPADLKQRITMMASFLSSAAAIVFMHRHRPHHATIDYSLFAVVRALDVFAHVAVKNRWGPSWVGPYGAVAVFVLACTEIMFSWMFEPERLPG